MFFVEPPCFFGGRVEPPVFMENYRALVELQGSL